MKIYLDMDGVIANFEKRYIELFREAPNACHRDRKEFSANWKIFIAGKHFEDLDWWPGGKELINYLVINKLDVEILSSSGGNKYHELVVDQKKRWLENEQIPSTWPVNIVAGRKKKAEYATPDSILIDDTEDVIKAFREAGGISIHHKDVGNTLSLLDIYLNRA